MLIRHEHVNLPAWLHDLERLNPYGNLKEKPLGKSL